MNMYINTKYTNRKLPWQPIWYRCHDSLHTMYTYITCNISQFEF